MPLFRKLAVTAAACLVQSVHAAPEAVVTPLMEKPLADYPGKEALMITVVYPPGDAHAGTDLL